MFVYAIRDSKAEAYLSPFVERTKATALRAFANAAADPNHNFHRYAGDYTLFEIGEWDECKGVVRMYSTHINLGNAIEYVPSMPVVDPGESASRSQDEEQE